MAEVKSYTAEEVASHNTREDLWIIYNNKVYDVTQYLDEHPGGEEVILDCAGQDSTDAFNDIGHSDDAVEQLEALYVGELIGGLNKKSGKSDINAGSTVSNLPLLGAGVVALAIVVYFMLN